MDVGTKKAVIRIDEVATVGIAFTFPGCLAAKPGPRVILYMWSANRAAGALGKLK